MSHAPLPNAALAQLFTDARSHHAWVPHETDDASIHQLYELFKWGPTSVNCSPARVLFVKSDAEKERLYPALMGGNVDQVKKSSFTAIVATDEKFYERLPKLFTAFDARSMFADNGAAAETTAHRNSTLQGAYLVLAARALGYDTCPMSGFDNAKVDEIFLSGTTWKSNFICAIGYGDPDKLYPRGPRLAFDEACKIL